MKYKNKENISSFTIAIIDSDGILSSLNNTFNTSVFTSQIDAFEEFKRTKFDMIISDVRGHQLNVFKFSLKLLKTVNKNTSFIIASKYQLNDYKEKIKTSNVTDFYHVDNIEKLVKRLTILKKVKSETKIKPLYHRFKYKANFIKRCVDVCVSGLALLIASPIMILVTIILKLQGKGPVMYRSRRVGSNFKIIDVYKFRTMIVDADKKLESLKDLNAYENKSDYAFNEDIKKSMLVDDSMVPILEKEYLSEVRNTPVFLKFKADPRVTAFGKILRKTSIDELPQLFNILKGDMSLVGNRPIPIPEGDKLTTDDAVSRFLAPAGLTGYWQVTQRGTNKISQKDRILMDNLYSRKRSLLFDITIITKTFKALIQNENQ